MTTPHRGHAVSTRIVVIAWLAAAVALIAHQILEPFTAGSHMGLFTNGGDLAIYRHGGQQVLDGQPLYASELPGGGWFTYPPFAAAAFIPLALMNITAAQVIWMLVSFGAVALTIWRCATTLGYRADVRLTLFSAALSLAAIDIEAVRGTLWQGQVNLVLMAVIVWDLTRPPQARLRGWSVGIAAGIKLTAIVFVPYLFITRQWRAGVTALAVATATVAITWCALPQDSAAYWSHAVFETDRIGPLTHPGNFSIGGILATLAAPAPMPTLWWIVAVAAATILGYVAAQRAHRAGDTLLGITIIGLLSCTVPPLAWGHHWVWTVPLLAVVIDRAMKSSGLTRGAWAVSAMAVYLTVFMWFSAWLYRTSHRLSAQYPNYVEALDAAIATMSKADRMLVVSINPALFVVTALAAIVLPRRRSNVALPLPPGDIDADDLSPVAR